MSIMSILRWHPLGQIENEFDRAHNDEMNRFLQCVGTRGPADPSGAPVAYPPVNVWDDDENIYLSAELPGITLENFEITVTDGTRLTLKGQRTAAEVGKTTWHRLERCFGSFSRTIILPVPVDPERVEARFELGDLRVKLAKSPEAKPRRIEVKQSRSGSTESTDRDRIMNTATSELNNPMKDFRTEDGQAANTRGDVFEPRVDMAEVDDTMMLYVDLPGVKSEDVDVRFENRELQIRGKVTPAATEPHLLLNEYGVGDYFRAFSVTDDIDTEKIRADLHDGVLTVHLPKAEALKQRRITVNA